MIADPELLKSMDAKYVACLKETKILKHATVNDAGLVIPAYSILWTTMEIKGAPPDVMVSWGFFSGNSILYENISLRDVVLIENFYGSIQESTIE